AELVFLTLDGKVMSPEERQQLAPRPAAEDEWADGLTAMRDVMTAMSDARIVLGGRVDGFKGRMPGVAEEALAALRVGEPLFVVGGFGGCARVIAEDLGLAAAWRAKGPAWPGRSEFAGFTARNLNNGLDTEENRILAGTVHIDEAVVLILRG